MTLSETQQKIQELESRFAAVTKRRAEYTGELRAKQQELNTLVRDIAAAGYNVKTLKADRDRAQEDLDELMARFDRDLQEAETGLSALDKKG